MWRRERERWGRVGGFPEGQGGEWPRRMIRQGARQRFGHLWLPWIPHPSPEKIDDRCLKGCGCGGKQIRAKEEGRGRGRKEGREEEGHKRN